MSADTPAFFGFVGATITTAVETIEPYPAAPPDAGAEP